ncbi:hypothetical protein E1B28_010015 [Marasmius oreades]|uniref:Uncharacterized protein n=1 Tax=Marasmius oreades TaxID=181124 RepID=A0A9P7RXQ0_9AGAR|nr:uncharacterized protein E1B28_010015 [Marasmius oreades]KAG7090943.1 hypothetical protein E1B28_010015 [Marasmius oreades]
MEDPFQTEYTPQTYHTNAYLRVASIAIAAYSFIETGPAVWKFYRDQLRSGRYTISFIMLILIQVSSIAALCISNFGFFYSHFTDASCKRYYLLPSIFKILQAMVSQLILGLRAFNLSTRSRAVGLVLIILYVAACSVEWTTTLYRRHMTVAQIHVCRGTFHPNSMSAWVYYVTAIIYDVGVTSISVVYLVKHQQTSTASNMMAKITKMMLYDGIGYFVFLTAVNVANLMIYREGTDIQTFRASFGYTATWILSQRLLIHLHEMSLERRNESMYEAYTISQTISSAQAVNRAVRSQFETKGSLADGLELTNPNFDLDILESGTNYADDVSHVQVHVEKTVTVQRRGSQKYTLENYSRHAGSVVTNPTISTRTISVVSTGRKQS